MNEALQGDIASLAGLAGRPVTVEELASVLGVDANEVMSAAEASASVSSSGAGYVADAPSVTPRVAYLSGAFADLLVARNADPVEIGRLLRKAGRDADALGHFVRAAEAGNADALVAALEINETTGGLEGAVEGDLRVRNAARLSDIGRTEEALDEAVAASKKLSGARLVDALGFAAAIADNLQRPQTSEALTGLAAGTAEALGEHAKAGSLLTLQARALSRIGFSDEADAVCAKGQAILAEHGTAAQRHTARNNEAIIMLDRGEARRAASAFDSLLASDTSDNPISRAIAEIYLARALFAAGESKRALPLAENALSVCQESGAPAPIMLGHMAVAEGALAAERHGDALASADAALAVVEADLPQWANRIHLLRAQAMLAAGDYSGAADAADAGLDATPEGANGWRVRRQLDAVKVMASPADQWPTARAEELTDEMLQARWYGIAVPLMAVRADREGDKELGLEAAALAHRLGAPMAAASAIQAVAGWGEPEAIPIAQAVKDLESHVAQEWVEDWKALPDVSAALAVDTDADIDDSLLDDRIDDALKTAGLAGVDVVLSPAQRRAKGLVRRKVRRRQGMPMWGMAASVIVSLGAILLILNAMGVLDQTEPTVTVITTETTTTTTTLPWTEVPFDSPVDITGSFVHRGNTQRTGEGEGGFREAKGIAWPDVKPGGFLSSPIAYGIRAFVASTTSDAVYAIELETGRVSTELETDDRVLASPAVGIVEAPRGAGSDQALLFAVSQRGTVYAKAPGTPTVLLEVELDEQVTAAPLMTGKIAVIGTEDGRVYGFNSGGVIWTYPAEGEEALGAIESAPSFADGTIYVLAGPEMIGLREDGSEVCRGNHSAGTAAIGSAMINDEWVLVQTEAGLVRIQPGKCGPGIPDPGTPRDQAPALANGIVYSVQGSSVFAFEPGTLTGDVVLEAGTNTVGYWPAVFDAGSAITDQVSIANGVLYVGTQAGDVFAVDAETGEEIWAFPAGSAIVGSPVVVNGSVLVATAEGEIIAITGE